MGFLDTLLGSGPEDPRFQQMGLLLQGLHQRDGVGGLLSANQFAAGAGERKLKQQLMEAQVAEVQAQAQERQSKAQHERAAMELAARKQAALPGLFGRMSPGAFAPSADGMGPVLPQSAAPQAGQFNVQAAIDVGYTPDEIMKYAGLRNANQDEVARTITEEGPGGAKIEQQYDKFGRKVGAGVNGYVAPVSVDTGKGTSFFTPRDGLNVGKVPTFGDDTARRGQDMSYSTAIRGQNMTDARSREANSNAAKPQFHDGQWVYPPSAAAPQGTVAPVPGYQRQLGEGAKKQVVGIDSLHAAIEEYKADLGNWSASDAMRPDKRAAMGTKYQNMMLQAKEAYNLGVLNGPDFQILSSTITNPMTWTGSVTSNKALMAQASELDRMMQRTRKAVTNQGAGGGASGGWGIQKVN